MNRILNLTLPTFIFSSLCALTVSQAAFAGSRFSAPPADPQKVIGLKALRSMVGCFMVDYTYHETESLKPGYALDTRVYDVNRNKTIKEWIYLDQVSDNHFRLQHLLFAVGPDGQLKDGSLLKHQAEDWEFNAPFLYDFVAPLTWDVVKLPADGRWTRRVTNLDDGLRYQCAAAWNTTTAYPEWSCADFAPIPGREFRDMKRTDYNTLQRTSRIQALGNSWLEREDNVKTIFANGVRTPLAKEFGKNWYVRLPDTECTTVRNFANPRKAFWDLLRDTWIEVLKGDKTYAEKPIGAAGPRYGKMQEVEDSYFGKDLRRPAIRQAAHNDILKVIQDFER